jgi:hypothetical protein
MNREINLTYMLADQLLSDVLCTVCESGAISYWAHLTGRAERGTIGSEEGQYLSVEIAEDEASDVGEPRRMRLDLDALAKGIRRVLAQGFNINSETRGSIERAVANGDAGEIDVDAADAIVQAAMFNALVYG